MKSHREALKAAIELGAVPAAVNALVLIAQSMVDRGEFDRAVDILALVMCYPMHPDTREVAEALFLDMESTVCPRIILDARTRADEMTLDDLALEILAETTE